MSCRCECKQVKGRWNRLADRCPDCETCWACCACGWVPVEPSGPINISPETFRRLAAAGCFRGTTTLSLEMAKRKGLVGDQGEPLEVTTAEGGA